jgi:hypothetical protein
MLCLRTNPLRQKHEQKENKQSRWPKGSCSLTSSTPMDVSGQNRSRCSDSHSTGQPSPRTLPIRPDILPAMPRRSRKVGLSFGMVFVKFSHDIRPGRFHRGKKNGPENTGRTAGKPFVHLIDRLKGVPLRNRKAVYLDNREGLLNGTFHFHMVSSIFSKSSVLFRNSL